MNHSVTILNCSGKSKFQKWKNLENPLPKYSKAIHTDDEILTFFFDYRGIMCVEFLEHATTDTETQY